MSADNEWVKIGQSLPGQENITCTVVIMGSGMQQGTEPPCA